MTEEARAAAEMAAVLQPLAPTNDTAAEYEQERTASLELIDFLKRRTSISNHSPALLDSLQASLNKGERPRALELRIDTNRVGWLFDVNDVWVLQYDVSWVSKEGAFALSPSLGLREDAYVDGSSTRPVQWFFDNLLPEEELRKSLAKEAQLAFEDVFGLLRHYGSESAGSLVLHPLGRPPAQEGLRELAPEELSARIRNLPIAPLTQGSPKRMSLAGAQHKMVVVAYSNEKGELEPTLFEPLPATPSTHILKPNSVAAAYPHSVANEYFSMRLAQRLKLDVPPVFRLYVPEPVYLITRFDRAQDKHTRHVSRLHVIDTCQLLNRSRVLKYDLARLETLAEAVEMTRSKALARRKLFQWMVFNTLLGNGDSHLKNLSFLVTRSGIELAPGYDMLCTAVYDTPAFADQNAIWPRTGLATTIPGANRFDQVTYAGLLEAGIALGLGAATAQRLLDGMLDRIEPAADYLLESLAKEYAETVARLGTGHPQAPQPAVEAGEGRLLRAIRHIVISSMVQQVRQSRHAKQ
ncbi:HipA domain-containing protein [Hydrogenophaga sp. H7]|uniref:HipA domain-containing protein n=1 Tax=Hydrogenophaga sp. H7 TaxID=1882399 RepID=UPI0021175123|nr:HipA domain-containing protein [Hydrogenophaga sp. H7]